MGPVTECKTQVQRKVMKGNPSVTKDVFFYLDAVIVTKSAL